MSPSVRTTISSTASPRNIFRRASRSATTVRVKWARTSSSLVSISTVSGDCTLGTVGGAVDATLTSGELRVDRCAGDVSVRSTSGGTRIGHCDGSDISVRSISGDVRMGLPTGIRVEADISTVSGKASMPEPAPPTAGERRPVRLKLKTVSGDIRITRSV